MLPITCVLVLIVNPGVPIGLTSSLFLLLVLTGIWEAPAPALVCLMSLGSDLKVIQG